ncbi:MAG: helix-turn-helix transcriptional regulator [Acidimicrobiales bacterium]
MARTWSIRGGEDFGRAIADIRRERHLTQQELATLAGIERTYLATIEGGRTGSLLEHMLRILRRLNVTITITMGDNRAEA